MLRWKLSLLATNRLYLRLAICSPSPTQITYLNWQVILIPGLLGRNNRNTILYLERNWRSSSSKWPPLGRWRYKLSWTNSNILLTLSYIRHSRIFFIILDSQNLTHICSKSPCFTLILISSWFSLERRTFIQCPSFVSDVVLGSGDSKSLGLSSCLQQAHRPLTCETFNLVTLCCALHSRKITSVALIFPPSTCFSITTFTYWTDKGHF